jgi:hypothetical protein
VPIKAALSKSPEKETNQPFGRRGYTMLTDSDRRIDVMYRAGLERIKLLCHFHLPKCRRPGCFRKLSSKDDRLGRTLCGICYTAELKAKRVKKILHTVVPVEKFHPLCHVSKIKDIRLPALSG